LLVLEGFAKVDGFVSAVIARVHIWWVAIERQGFGCQRPVLRSTCQARNHLYFGKRRAILSPQFVSITCQVSKYSFDRRSRVSG